MIPVQWIVYGVIALAVTAGATTVVVTYNRAIARAEAAEAAQRDATEKAQLWMDTAAKVSENLNTLNRQLASRETSRRKLQEERDEALKTLATLRETDPVVADWVDTPLPSAVASWLRDDATSRGTAGSAVPGPSTKPDAANATPPVSR